MSLEHPLRDDVEVDTPRVRRNCYPALASAIHQLHVGWKTDSKKRRIESVSVELHRRVDSALATYRNELVSDGYRKLAGPHSLFSRYLRRFGRERLETRLVRIHRLLRRNPCSDTSCTSVPRGISLRLFEGSSAPVQGRHEVDRALNEALDTIDALISVAYEVSSLRPKSKTLRGVTIKNPSWSALCRFCGSQTEMEMYALSGHWPKESKISVRDEAVTRRNTLSRSLCHEHASRAGRGRASSNYRRLLRAETEIKQELSGLMLASCRIGMHHTTLENALIYEFRRRIVDDRNLYLYDESKLSDAARTLVDHGMSDQKKLIVMMRRAGATGAGIARRLGISRQAVSKAMNTVPMPYRFDLRPFSKPNSELPNSAAALQ